jgi:hypothetical protein
VCAVLDRLRPATSAETLAPQFLNDANRYESGLRKTSRLAWMPDALLHDRPTATCRRQSTSRPTTSRCPTARSDRTTNPKKSRGLHLTPIDDEVAQCSDRCMTTWTTYQLPSADVWIPRTWVYGLVNTSRSRRVVYRCTQRANRQPRHRTAGSGGPRSGGSTRSFPCRT